MNADSDSEHEYAPRDYDLTEARKHPSNRVEAAHQSKALTDLRIWYESAPAPDAGGLLVLPTGGGKTFTAVRFLCRNPLSDDYKVLWLAHTHHLLEQALDSFGKHNQRADEMEVGLIHEPKERLRARVVSGTPGHSRIAAITPDDDVVICTLQSAARAYREGQADLRAFIDSAKGKLMVVFDEAHHAPAPSYTEFILSLRRDAPKMKLLGLTATPMYNDEKRAGWLKKLFPQGTLSQVSASTLIAAGILAKPVFQSCSTQFVPQFDPAQFQRWSATNQDVPEDIITELAKNQQRNDTICKTYVDRRDEFGKTIIFADRWTQCDYLRTKLKENGVRADVVYSHKDATLRSVDDRNRRTRDENAVVLKKFHENQLDVLINVRMLTEGTDVPQVQSVFLTRQTKSRILLRQMIGRALRGEKFGGTATANIVFFTDAWRESIQWAEFDDLWTKEPDGSKREPRTRQPLQLISIELIRRLARQMESGELAPASFLELLPLGWYVPEFDVEMPESDDIEHVHPMVLVYADEKTSYDAFLEDMAKTELRRFADPSLQYEAVEQELEELRNRFFVDERQRASGLGRNLFDLVRHVAQTGEHPPFFAFELREEHDLTPHVKIAAQEDWGPTRTSRQLEAFYLDERRFWRAMFPRFELFVKQFQALVEGELARVTGAGGTIPVGSVIAPPAPMMAPEPSEEIKGQVIRRDGERCLCCGETNRRRLQIDHIISRYHRGTNELANLQTLCSTCNRDKNIQEMHFRNTGTLLHSAPPLRFPTGFNSSDLEDIEHDIQRTINMFYQCAAVDQIEIGRRGVKRREWRIRLRSGNQAKWFEPHLRELFHRIREAQADDRTGPIESLTLEGSGDKADAESYVVREEDSEGDARKTTARKPAVNFGCNDPGVVVQDSSDCDKVGRTVVQSDAIADQTIVAFHDQDGKIDHDKFQKWRRKHPDGFYLAIKSEQEAKLHGVSCRHQGDPSFKYAGTYSNTGKRKVCADSRKTLMSWAKNEGFTVSRCAHCL